MRYEIKIEECEVGVWNKMKRGEKSGDGLYGEVSGEEV